MTPAKWVCLALYAVLALIIVVGAGTAAGFAFVAGAALRCFVR